MSNSKDKYKNYIQWITLKKEFSLHRPLFYKEFVILLYIISLSSNLDFYRNRKFYQRCPYRFFRTPTSKIIPIGTPYSSV